MSAIHENKLRELTSIPRKFNIGDKVEARSDTFSTVGIIVGCVQQLDHIEGNHEWAYSLGWFDAEDGHMDYFWFDECQLDLVKRAPVSLPLLVHDSEDIDRQLAQLRTHLEQPGIDLKAACLEAYLKFLICRSDLQKVQHCLNSVVEPDQGWLDRWRLRQGEPTATPEELANGDGKLASELGGEQNAAS